VSDGPPQVLVLVTEKRVEEGLRMASALPLCDTRVDVYLLGRALPETQGIASHLETLTEFGAGVLAPFHDPRVKTIASREMAVQLTRYDHVLTY
jgi:hypothetical protein